MMSNITINDILKHLKEIAPLHLQASYDNSGLLVGDSTKEVSGVITCLDCTEAVIDEAIESGANVIVAHHPIVFSGLKSLTGRNYVERTVIKAIKSDVSIIAWHTNLDSVLSHGVNTKIAELLSLRKLEILKPENALLKLEVNGSKSMLDRFVFWLKDNKLSYIPLAHGVKIVHNKQRIDHIRAFLAISFKGLFHHVNQLDDLDPTTGAGLIGELDQAMSKKDFLGHLKTSMGLKVLKYTKSGPDYIRRVALCGGSGSFLRFDAIAKSADVFITGDMKHHELFDGEEKCTIVDIGHYESEKFTAELLNALLSKKFSTFAIRISKIDTNPIDYYH